MSNMESVIRPFGVESLAPLPTPGRRNFIDPAIVLASFGGAGGRTASWTISGDGSVVPPQTDNFRESSRTSVSRRVENPDDPSQFVEFCQAKRVSLSPENGSGRGPSRSTSYDLSGGYHDLTGGAGRAGGRVYNYSAPTSRNCNDKTSPDTGCG